MRPLVLAVITLLALAASQQAADESLNALVDSLRIAKHLPGLAVIVARGDGAPRVLVSGVRRNGSPDTITSADRMHLGSNGKAITATVIGALVEQQKLTFETTLAVVFPDVVATMRPEYRNVTVRQLLAHAAGLAGYGDSRDLGWVYRLKGQPGEMRRAFVRRVLEGKPIYPPGTEHRYSNAGVTVAGAMAERITGRSFEELADELVFRPLGGRAAFGNPGLDSRPQPLGHVRGLFGRISVVSPRDEDYVVPPALAPAGDLSPTLQDYALFLQAHLRGLEGRDGFLRAATIKELHTPVPPADSDVGWALGWGIVVRDGVDTHGHTGSAGAYVAIVAIQPTRDLALALVTNIGGDEATTALSEIRRVITPRIVGTAGEPRRAGDFSGILSIVRRAVQIWSNQWADSSGL